MKSPAEELGELLSPHVGRADVLAEVEVIYADIDRFVVAERLTCDACGACCRFAEFGHRLYVTTPELVHFLTKLRQEATGVAIDRSRLEPLACPFQVGRQCGVRAIRPADCRVFFCGKKFSEAVNIKCEEVHRRLRSICQTRSLPYVYVEWSEGLKSFLLTFISPLPDKAYGKCSCSAKPRES